MRTFAIISVLTLSLAFAGCSKPTQEKTSEDLKAAGAKVGDAAKDVANAPEVQAVGADIKQGASEAADKTKAAAAVAADKTKVAAADAGEKLKAGAKKAGADIKEGADKAAAKTDAALNNASDRVQQK